MGLGMSQPTADHLKHLTSKQKHGNLRPQKTVVRTADLSTIVDEHKPAEAEDSWF
jgi:hypothetical protein